MKKKIGGKINFLQKGIFMEIKCVQTLALVTPDPLCCCQLCEISHRQLTFDEKRSIYTRGGKIMFGAWHSLQYAAVALL